ncbi:hypothetical protein ACFQPA_06180 [Halomarina halobia]|uniref:ACT domain-containing protein n=1 Tax=Halomarina halobia TaxID=3033386 RepID=A0ABD6A6J3_9EURY|nr:hypothetical protein [Halomarina sp. PSR21]
MSLAAETRAAVRARPFLYDALRAGVVNYAAAARYLDVGDEEAVTAALRRYAEELDDYEPPSGAASVAMRSGLGAVATGDGGDEDGGGGVDHGERARTDAPPLLRVGESAYGPGGSLTGVLATGDVNATALAEALARLRAEGIAVEAAAVAGSALVVLVKRRDGPNAVRAVESVVGR